MSILYGKNADIVGCVFNGVHRRHSRYGYGYGYGYGYEQAPRPAHHAKSKSHKEDEADTTGKADTTGNTDAVTKDTTGTDGADASGRKGE